MAGTGMGSGGADNPERWENARITRGQLRIQIARWRESMRQQYRRFAKKQPWQ